MRDTPPADGAPRSVHERLAAVAATPTTGPGWADTDPSVDPRPNRETTDVFGTVVNHPVAATDVGTAAAVDEQDPIASDTPDPGPGWGISAMPAWLDPQAAWALNSPGRAGQRPLDGQSDSGTAEEAAYRAWRRRDFEIDDLDECAADGRTRYDPARDGQDRDDSDGYSPVRRRFAVAPPAAVALILVGVIACAVAGYELFRGSEATPEVAFPPRAGVSTSTPTQASPGPQAQPASAPPTDIVVSVVGLVHRPGLVHLTPNSRVADAIAHAGGPRQGADMVSLNLAQVIRDGDQVLVGFSGQKGQASLHSAVVSGSGSSAAPADGAAAQPSGAVPNRSGTPAAGTVNLNTATEAQLDALPGVGPVTAKAILAWRSAHGRFTSVDQLGEVDGIGPARLAKLRDQVSV